MTSETPMRGAVEFVSPGYALGWAWDPNAPGAHVEVQLLTADGALVALARADKYRSDLERSAIGDGRHGFVLQIPETAEAMASPRFKIAGHDADLPFSDDVKRQKNVQGHIDHAGDAAIFGWVWDPSDPAAIIAIEVLDGDAVIATAAADTFRADLYAAKIGDGRHAFMVRLPAAEPSGTRCDAAGLQVRVAGTSVMLPRAANADASLSATWFTPDSDVPALADGSVEPMLLFDAESAAAAISPTDYAAVAAVFDLGFYASRNQDALQGVANPINHFLARGWREGRSPAPWFSINLYVARNEDVLCAGINPLVHYLLAGKPEGRPADPAGEVADEIAFRAQLAALSKFFDAQFYIEQAKNVDLQIIDPLTHYYFRGWRERLDPCPWFSITDYLRAYPDIRAANIEPFSHYLQFGKAEGRQPTRKIRNDIEADFDKDFYLSQIPHLHGQDPIDHFVARGWRTGFNPRQDFSVAHYLRMNPDVAKAKINPFWHYVVAGRSEGRSAFPSNSRKIAINPKLPKMLFVGHDALHAGAEVVLLEIIRWFADHTRYPIKLILLGAGRLVANYAEYADTFVIDGNLDEVLATEDLQSFLDDEFLTCYVNTVASARFWKIIKQYRHLETVPTVLHVHEMEMIIREFETDFVNLAPHVTSMVAVSNSVRDTLTGSFNCRPEQVFLSNAFIHVRAGTVHEAALKRQDARRDLKLWPSDFVVVGCGTVYSRKGPDLFLDAATKCVARSAIPNVKFVWIGDGTDLETLRDQVSARGLEPYVRFIGVRDNANELIAAADVFFLPSREDPFPLVCLEAAQYGIPTVYFTGATGITEFSGNDAGIGVPSFDTDAALDAIQLYAHRPARLERAGATARSRLLEGYTAEKRVLEIALHLRQVCHLQPAVSVIVPTYNHGRFVRDRLDSILSQSLSDIEVIVLDDCSEDDTVQVIQEYLHDPRVRLIVNDVNSGGPFTQWANGVGLAASPLVWIAEGDDCASDTFLAEMLPAFDDPAVNLAFCHTEIIDQYGARQPGALDGYLGMSNFPFGRPSVKMDGFAAVESGFGTMCLIVNASAAVFRKNRIGAAIETAKSFQMCGDWLVYLAALSTGKLVYTAAATNFFRRHTASAVHKLEGTPQYFDERFRIAAYVLENFHISRQTFRLALAHLDGEWARFAGRNPGLEKEDLFDCTPLFNKYLETNHGRALKIGFYVHGMLFSKGGIERLASQLANELSRRGHQVTIFCRAWGGAAPVYPLNESVETIGVFDEDDLQHSVPAMRIALAKRDLDVFIPMLSEWLFEPVIEACEGLGIPVIASEHNDPGKIEELWWPRARRLDCFAKVSAVHLLLDRFRDSLPPEFRSKIHVIPNGIEALPPVPAALFAGDRPKRIIGIGRLERQKRFDRLIKAFALAKLPGWRLDIFGEGSERQHLQSLIDANGLGDRATLRGNTSNIPSELLESAIFVLPSAFEGFGIVVLEAKQAGVPSIAYRNCNGPNELINDGMDGLLVDDDETGESLAQALASLAVDAPRRRTMGNRAIAAVAAFDMDTIVTRWEQTIIKVLRRDANTERSLSIPPRAVELGLRVVSG